MDIKNPPLAWHFSSEILSNGDSSESVRLHASKRLIDALANSSGCFLHRVECREIVEGDNNEFACRERKTLWAIDAEDLLRRFARLCALDVVHLWDCPAIVLQYLKTGDESIKSAADSAADSEVDWAAYSAAYWAANTFSKKKQNRRLTSMVSRQRLKLICNQR